MTYLNEMLYSHPSLKIIIKNLKFFADKYDLKIKIIYSFDAEKDTVDSENNTLTNTVDLIHLCYSIYDNDNTELDFTSLKFKSFYKEFSQWCKNHNVYTMGTYCGF